VKVLLLSILTAILTFFGINKVSVESVQIIPPTPTVELIEVNEPVDDATGIVTPSPTVVIKPSQKITTLTSSINEGVLMTVFGLQNKQQINHILSTPSEIDGYEKKYYEKFKDYPVPRVTITNSSQLIAMPNQNGFTICTGQQLQLVYSEIEKTEKEIEYEKMDYECHHDSSKQETEECRTWRRDNDQNKTNQEGSEGTIEDLQRQIQEYTKKVQERQSVYDQLLEKYCLRE